MARFRHNQIPNELSLESPLFNLLGAQLAAMGHNVKSVNGAVVGGVQSILFTADPRAESPSGDNNKANDRVGGLDGAAVGW